MRFNTIDAFRIFDHDNNGSISIENLQRAFEEMNIHAQPEKLIMRYDKDQDGSLNY